jgi:tRNA threonylcarbamoyladenosine biosynthesis protein TsaB
MKVLAIDTATERCSVALRHEGRVIERVVDTERNHAELVLPMVSEVLTEARVELRTLDGIAYGRGPGAFTGVRIAVSVVQGLAFGANLAVVGISDLTAIAQQVAYPGAEILVCVDARMGEVYWGTFVVAPDSGLAILVGEERVDRPEQVRLRAPTVLAGTGFSAYPQLAHRAPDATIHERALPQARDIAMLGELELAAGRGRPAAQAQPVYLRNQVVSVRTL